MSSVILGDCRPIARRVHDCDYCGQDIPIGQRYRRWTCVQDREARTVKAHIACNDVAQAYWRDIGAKSEERWVQFEPMGEWTRGYEDPSMALVKLSANWAPGELVRVATLIGLGVPL